MFEKHPFQGGSDVQLKFQIVDVESGSHVRLCSRQWLVRTIHWEGESPGALTGPRSLGKYGKAECGEQVEDLIQRGW